MSEENVEIVQRGVEAYLRGDIEAFLEQAGPEVEIDFSRVRGPYRGVYRGREEARRLFGAYREAWEEITPLSTEYFELGDKVVLAARWRFWGRG
jgi:ketosteroid isomerase-like protein